LTCGGTNNKVKTWNIIANPATEILVASYSSVTTCSFLTATTIGIATGSDLEIATISPPTGISISISQPISACN
jgi:hypothetical protein